MQRKPKSSKSSEFPCEFCEKTFVKESSLMAHSCTKKMRWLDKNNKNSAIAFIAYKRFYQLSGISRKLITFENFIESKMYNDFLFFGRWVNDGGILNIEAYTDYLIKGKFKIKDWTKSSVYEGYLRTYLFKESPLDALERTIAWIQKWSQESNEKVENFFEKASTYKVVDILRNGKISPWIFFMTDKAHNLLDRFDDTQYKLLGNLLDTKIWNIKIKKYSSELEECKTIMRSMGL